MAPLLPHRQSRPTQHKPVASREGAARLLVELHALESLVMGSVERVLHNATGREVQSDAAPILNVVAGAGIDQI